MYDYEYWLFDDTAEVWSPFLTEDMQETFRVGGYYTAEISQGLRLVAINTPLYYTNNDQVDPNTDAGSVYLRRKKLMRLDPAGMLAWMTSVLDSAVSNGEKVVMSYHIPSGFVAGAGFQFKIVRNISNLL